MTWLYIYAAFMLGVVCGMFTLALLKTGRSDYNDERRGRP